MNLKKITSIFLAAVLVAASFSACSAKDPIKTSVSNIVAVTDSDDDEHLVVDELESNTVDVVDSKGNTLTLVPVFNLDGSTVIAGYIQSAKSLQKKDLDEKKFEYLKSVIAVTVDDDGNYTISYDHNGDFIVFDSLSNMKGYIIAMQDVLDLDKDKDVEEYFKIDSKLDSNGNLFIKVKSDPKGNPINVKVEKDKDDNKTIVDEDGKKTKVQDTKDSKNIKDLTDKAKKDKIEKQKKESTTKASNKDDTSTTKANDPTKPSNPSKPNDPTKPNPTKPAPTQPAEPEVDYTAIVLKKNGKVETTGDNVSIEGSALDGGVEVKIDGPGKYNKYYVTAETDKFLGQLEFDLHVGDDIEVKLYDVCLDTQRKTALKFVNLDSTDEKQADTETGTDMGQSGNDRVSSAPNVELSLTGTNKISAGGSGKNGSLYSECKLAIKGHGSASIDGGDSLSGICSTESITIKNATLNIKSRAKQGISCDKKVTVKSGATINIESMGDCIHCNKFEYDGKDADGVSKDSVIECESMSEAQGKDGIDADNEIIIKGGKLNVKALTPGKMAIKIRKIEDESERGLFEIRGGTVTSSGYLNTMPTSCGQKTVYATYAGKSTVSLTVGSFKSVSGSKSFICSPTDASSISSSAGGTANIKWNGNLGTVIIK